jgi:spore coat polysaccharide biosynthesis protein SpsF
MIGVIIQARMGSTRLPGKVLKLIDGISLLEYQINRIKKSTKQQKIIVATSSEAKDDAIETLCKNKGILCFRGSENDVLARYYKCAKFYKLDVVIRLTADCPLVDPIIIDKVANLFLIKNVDYCANTAPASSNMWPDGSDVEIFSFSALERAHQDANNPEDREHVTFYFWKYKSNAFRTAQLLNNENWSEFRFTIDYPEDYEAMICIVKEMKARKIFGHVSEIITILKESPDIKKLNDQYYFGLGWKQ